MFSAKKNIQSYASKAQLIKTQWPIMLTVFCSSLLVLFRMPMWSYPGGTIYTEKQGGLENQ
jgi:hypothetical protein